MPTLLTEPELLNKCMDTQPSFILFVTEMKWIHDKEV